MQTYALFASLGQFLRGYEKQMCICCNNWRYHHRVLLPIAPFYLRQGSAKKFENYLQSDGTNFLAKSLARWRSARAGEYYGPF